MVIRLGLIDSNSVIRYGLRELVAQHADIEVAVECAAAATAVQLTHAAAPDVVIVADDLTDGDGMRLAGELRVRYPDLGIVILATGEADDLMFRALEAGASAFLVRTAPVDEVIAAVRHAAVAASSFTASGLADAISRRRAAQQEQQHLSPREEQVLSLLCDGMSIPAIAQVMFISPSTAKTYVARLYEKLGAANRAQAVMMAMHHGLVSWQPAPGAAGHAAQKTSRKWRSTAGSRA